MRLIIVTLSAFAMMLSCNPSDNKAESDDTQNSYSIVDATDEETLNDIDTRTDMNKTSVDEEASTSEDQNTQMQFMKSSDNLSQPNEEKAPSQKVKNEKLSKMKNESSLIEKETNRE